MRYLAVALLILYAVASQANAGTAVATTYGAGGESCGKWLTSRNDEVQRFVKLNWVLGWVSAAAKAGQMNIGVALFLCLVAIAYLVMLNQLADYRIKKEEAAKPAAADKGPLQ